MLEYLIPNCGIEDYISDRRVGLVKLKPLNPKSSMKVRTIREGSFFIHGLRLFNCLLASINNCSVTVFKQHLDLFLNQITDQPICDTLKPYSNISLRNTLIH